MGKDDTMCFACGKDNPISLGLDFRFNSEDEVEAGFIPEDVHQGFNTIMHGGLVSTLLDEAMAKVIYMNGIRAYTAEMKTRFKKPVEIGEKVIITGILNKQHGKLLFAEAYLKNNKGDIMARAEGKFIKVLS